MQQRPAQAQRKPHSKTKGRRRRHSSTSSGPAGGRTKAAGHSSGGRSAPKGRPCCAMSATGCSSGSCEAQRQKSQERVSAAEQCDGWARRPPGCASIAKGWLTIAARCTHLAAQVGQADQQVSGAPAPQRLAIAVAQPLGQEEELLGEAGGCRVVAGEGRGRQVGVAAGAAQLQAAAAAPPRQPQGQRGARSCDRRHRHGSRSGREQGARRHTRRGRAPLPAAAAAASSG